MAYAAILLLDLRRILFISTALVVSWTLVCFDAAAADKGCAGVDTSLTDARRHEYAPLVAAALEHKVRPAAVELSHFMQSGSWSAVSASTPLADDGVLFFEEAGGRKQFKDAWGGWADPSERSELVDWAKGLGAPERLATCFAQTVIDEE
jgi:hypothetical protein